MYLTKLAWLDNVAWFDDIELLNDMSPLENSATGKDRQQQSEKEDGIHRAGDWKCSEWIVLQR
jgi:hypothetical protein